MHDVIERWVKASGPLSKVAGWFFIGLSIICFVVSIILYFSDRSFMQSAIRADGVITRLIENKESNSKLSCKSVVRFRDTHSAPHEFVSTFAMYPAPYKLGETVSVFYPPEQPEKAVLNTFFEVWGIATIFGIVAGGQLLAGLAFLVVRLAMRKYRRLDESGMEMNYPSEAAKT